MNDELPMAISGTRRKAGELSDGTLRVTVDIDPRFIADFQRLFPRIDMPIALAPLVANFERIEKEEKQKGGPLCKLAATWCKDEEFQEWLALQFDMEPMDEDGTTDFFRGWMGVMSRKELDHNSEAAERFKVLVRAPFMEWMKDK